MGLIESLRKEYCFCPVEGDDKQQVLSNLIRDFSIAAKLDGKKEEDILDAVMKREALGPTGLEEGVAIPHAKLPFIESSVVAVGLGRKEIDYGSADGKPTNLYFLVLGSDSNPSEHIQVLAQIAKLAKNPSVLRLLKSSKSGSDLAGVFF